MNTCSFVTKYRLFRCTNSLSGMEINFPKSGQIWFSPCVLSARQTKFLADWEMICLLCPQLWEKNWAWCPVLLNYIPSNNFCHRHYILTFITVYLVKRVLLTKQILGLSSMLYVSFSIDQEVPLLCPKCQIWTQLINEFQLYNLIECISFIKFLVSGCLARNNIYTTYRILQLVISFPTWWQQYH